VVRGQAKVESLGLDLDQDLDLDLELVRPELGRAEAVRAEQIGEDV
jgi:hypothetical protein